MIVEFTQSDFLIADMSRQCGPGQEAPATFRWRYKAVFVQNLKCFRQARIQDCPFLDAGGGQKQIFQNFPKIIRVLL